MTRILDVYLHNNLVRLLEQNKEGQLVFAYSEQWLKNKNAKAISQSLPLQKASFNHKQCRAFFAGILPDEDKRRKIAKNLGVSANNDFALLEKIGGECAGAITFIQSGKSLPLNDDHYQEITEKELASIFRSLPRHPLMAGDKGVRLSLAGAQDKIAVKIENKKIFIPQQGAPSTHILKPTTTHIEGLVFNEALCLKLANAINIPTVSASVAIVEDIAYLCVERYDRITNSKQKIQRLHQEDFCQALNIAPEMKYQSEGGPSLRQCFDLTRNISNSPIQDLQQLLDTVIFNFLIGNHDAHGKNFSLLYHVANRIKLAPLYDIVCTAYYPELSTKMAMKVASKYYSDEIYPRHFEQFAEETHLSKAIVRQRMHELLNNIQQQLEKIDLDFLFDQNRTASKVARFIQERCKKISKRF